MIEGIGAAAGVAIGKAFVLPSWEWDLPDQKMDAVDLAKEFERLYEGIRTSKSEIQFIKDEFREMVYQKNPASLMLILRYWKIRNS